ncbi:MAG TPA: hypothetical protein VIL46_06545, partial [Gemmataceae bacterium]
AKDARSRVEPGREGGMPEVPRVGDLQIDQDLAQQGVEWTVQRVAWYAMLLVLLLALIGLLGNGPLSTAVAEAPDGSLRAEFNRFVHYLTPETLRFDVAAGAARDGELRLWLDLQYLRGVQIRGVTPQPLRVEAGPDRHTYVFRAPDAQRPTTVLFHLEAERRWSLSGGAGVEGKEPLRFDQVVYP